MYFKNMCINLVLAKVSDVLVMLNTFEWIKLRDEFFTPFEAQWLLFCTTRFNIKKIKNFANRVQEFVGVAV